MSDRVASALVALDVVLTGMSETRARQTLAGQRAVLAQIAEGCGGLYYLSDGGYSRVLVREDGEVVLVTGATGSTSAVMERWQSAGVERSTLESAVRGL